MFEIVLTVIMSIAIGLFMGVIGGGGGGIFIVVLLLFLKQDAKTAAMTALVLSTITMCGAAWQYWRNSQFRKDYFILLAVLDIVGTLLGNLLLSRINEHILTIVIVCVLVLSGLSSLLKIKSSDKKDEDISKAVNKLPATVPIGLASGLATGTTGLSGNTMVSSYLIGFLDFSPYLAVGTTTLVSFVGNFFSIIMLCISSYSLHVTKMYIDVETLLTLGIGSGIGAFFGAKLTTKVNRKVLTLVLAALAIIPGIYLLIKK